MRTLLEINRDFMASNAEPRPISPMTIEAPPAAAKAQESAGPPERRRGKEKRGILAAASDMMFYLAILVMFFSILTSGTDGGRPKSIFGYSYFTVISNSMKDEIPKGAFVLVKETAPRGLEIGDNITFMRDRYDSVTHKIINIYENYDNSGARGFQTKGVNNLNPDRDIVYEASVIGKVILVLPGLGAAISYLGENIHIVFIVFAVCVIASFGLRGVFAGPSGKTGAGAA
ncbi:MAG: signal peptidase I [Oscillospiraceae bacterium]|nr:signal peptidase I [Oscillospiraceae bacterium]